MIARSSRRRVVPDVAVVLAWAFRRPLGRFLDEGEPDSVVSDLTDTTESWDNYSINHATRGLIWLSATVVFLALGIASAVVENTLLSAGHDPVSGPVEVLFGVCAVTALMHGFGLLVSNSLEKRAAAGSPGWLAKIFLGPGNRYLIVSSIAMILTLLLSQ